MISVWVHRRHESFPDVGVGWQEVTLATAGALIRAHCAQGGQTDGRRLLPIDLDTVVRAPKPRKSAARTAAETPAPSAPPRRYKRRDMRAES